MNSRDLVGEQRLYLSKLLEAIQRCTYFLHYSEQKLNWPMQGQYLTQHKKDLALFETLSATNERFAKLQDAIAAAMRHAALLMSEPDEGFLKTLAFYEKQGVIGSVHEWQRGRMARNLAAHDYETDYAQIAEHFNTLHELSDTLYHTASRLIALCEQTLRVTPYSLDFQDDFEAIINSL